MSAATVEIFIWPKLWQPAARLLCHIHKTVFCGARQRTTAATTPTAAESAETTKMDAVQQATTATATGTAGKYWR